MNRCLSPLLLSGWLRHVCAQMQQLLCMLLCYQETCEVIVRAPRCAIENGRGEHGSALVEGILLVALVKERHRKCTDTDDQPRWPAAIPGAEVILAPAAASPAKGPGRGGDGLPSPQYGLGDVGEFGRDLHAGFVGDWPLQFVWRHAGHSKHAGLIAAPAGDRSIAKRE